MNFPLFDAGVDPGPDFVELLRRSGVPSVSSLVTTGAASVSDVHRSGGAAAGLDVPHGTTVVAVRYTDGVVMAGDRRATAGNWISHRTIEKVFPADRHSGIAIAGAAGPAVEMVKLFQLQLEHYEKVEGTQLSLEGKANQLSGMVRGHLPAAMAGMAVVPIFAGFDQRRAIGRLFEYDVTGGRYEEQAFAASGSGSLHASTIIKIGFTEDLEREAAIRLVIRSLMVAADEDSATGSPDHRRSIYPVTATITADGFDRLGDEELRDVSRSIEDAGEVGQ